MKTFYDYLEEIKKTTLTEEEAKVNELYSYKRDEASRPTMVLKVTEKGWEKIKDLFDAQGVPKSSKIKNLTGPTDSSLGVWDLHAQKISGGKYVYRIWGRSGDYTFGLAPAAFPSNLGGNIKVAKKIFSSFIDKFLSDDDSIEEAVD